MTKHLHVVLEGEYAEHFDRALADTNRAPGPPLNGDELATALIVAILEDDACHERPQLAS